ncbi:hypothetical protein [Photorhabdus noenieputensis]
MSGRCPGRVVSWRGGAGARLPESAGVDGGTVCAEPVCDRAGAG